jgi:hypothetical protein
MGYRSELPPKFNRVLSSSDPYSSLKQITVGKVSQNVISNIRSRNTSYMAAGLGCNDLH